MKYLIGSRFWKLNTPESDYDYYEFVFPSLDDLYYGKSVSKQLKDKDGNDVNLKDIRNIVKELKKGNVNMLQVIYSKPVDLLNQKEELLDNFMHNHKYEIFNEVRYEILKAVIGESNSRIREVEKNFNGKSLAHLCRLKKIVETITNNLNPFDVLLQEKTVQELRNIRENPTKQIFDQAYNFFIDIKNKKITEDMKVEKLNDKPTIDKLDKLIKREIFSMEGINIELL